MYINVTWPAYFDISSVAFYLGTSYKSDSRTSDKTLTDVHILPRTLCSPSIIYNEGIHSLLYKKKTRSSHNFMIYHDDVHLVVIPFHLRPPGRGNRRHLHRLHGRRLHHYCSAHVRGESCGSRGSFPITKQF